MQYFKNNVKAMTYHHCHAIYMDYPAYQQERPLFLKILTDYLTASDEQSKESLLKSIKPTRLLTLPEKIFKLPTIDS